MIHQADNINTPSCSSTVLSRAARILLLLLSPDACSNLINRDNSHRPVAPRGSGDAGGGEGCPVNRAEKRPSPRPVSGTSARLVAPGSSPWCRQKEVRR